MNVKNNYHECITNLACSIRKYFNLKLFGDGEENEIFRDELGDFLAITKTNK